MGKLIYYCFATGILADRLPSYSLKS